MYVVTTIVITHSCSFIMSIFWRPDRFVVLLFLFVVLIVLLYYLSV